MKSKIPALAIISQIVVPNRNVNLLTNRISKMKKCLSETVKLIVASILVLTAPFASALAASGLSEPPSVGSSLQRVYAEQGDLVVNVLNSYAGTKSFTAELIVQGRRETVQVDFFIGGREESAGPVSSGIMILRQQDSLGAPFLVGPIEIYKITKVGPHSFEMEGNGGTRPGDGQDCQTEGITRTIRVDIVPDRYLIDAKYAVVSDTVWCSK